MSKLAAGIGAGLGTAGCLAIIALCVFVIAIGPLCLLWGSNFILGECGIATIPLTLKSWFGAFLVIAALQAKVSYKK